jgi:TDG/mug DNA glycosylase family protein
MASCRGAARDFHVRASSSAHARSIVTRPSRQEIAAAVGRTIPDLIAPGLDVLFVGINPGLYSGATGHHFARPGNRFWRTLHLAGFTPRLLAAGEQEVLLGLGIGITNLVERTTATAAELHPEELRAGASRVRAKVERFAPRTVAFLGVSTFRSGFERPAALVGRQPDRIGHSEVWVLPNPSGLNAHYQLPRLVEAYAELRASVRSRGDPFAGASGPAASGHGTAAAPGDVGQRPDGVSEGPRLPSRPRRSAHRG